MLKISEHIRYKNIDTYRRLRAMAKKVKKDSKEIRLGDTPENLMKHDGHKRIGRRLKQTKWAD